MFFAYDFGKIESRFSWEYDRFFWNRWCAESLEALRVHPQRTEDPAEAQFFVVTSTLSCVSFADVAHLELIADLPHRDGRRPHVVFDLTDQPMPIFEGEDLVVCKSAWHEDFYDPFRSVAIPQFPRYRFGNPSLSASQRPYLAGFKGNLRSRFNELRARLTALDDNRHMMLKSGVFQPNHLEISADGKAYEVTREGELSYTEILFDSCFALLPRGNGVALSYRMIECMDAGCVPVILSDGFVLPFSEILDYGSFSLRFPEAEVKNIRTLLEAEMPRANELQAVARRTFQTHFSSTATLLNHTLVIVAGLWSTSREGESKTAP